MESREFGFAEFSTEEIDVGMEKGYSLGIRLDRFILRDIANHAGAMRLARQAQLERRVDPREVMLEAIRHYEQNKRGGRRLPRHHPEAYVRAFAQMLNGRVPAVIKKRERDARKAEAAAIGVPNDYERASRGV